ncbi:uncharacterized protein TNCV_1955321 [Trichonephila clavipes]|nr:uncharacterized protein TNCV_1955321 [Trichonephila clavipes]
MIILAWLRKEQMDLKTFVQNRVAKIQELYPNQLWRHAPSDQNPADLVSRGVDPEKLLQQNLWFNGPTFLSGDDYPNRTINCREKSLNSLEEPNLTKCKESNLKKWQKITKIVQLMWKFWSRNYLNQLQQRGKWMFEKNNVKIGDLVLIIEENLPTYKWALGRIVELYYGEDKKCVL